MEMPLGQRILLIVVAICFLILIILYIGVMIEIITQKVVGVKEVDCYDKYSNKIEGVKCEEKTRCGVISKLFKVERCEVEKKKSIEYNCPISLESGDHIVRNGIITTPSGKKIICEEVLQ